MSRVLIIGSHAPVSREIGESLCAASLPVEYSAGNADALKRLRIRAFGVVITSADSALDENLVLIEEMRSIRPALKCIVLAEHSTPDKVIAALRARVFACFTPPFDSYEIANLARQAASDSKIGEDIEILSARPGWVSVRVNSRIITAERLLSFAKELSAQLPEDAKQDILQALREILLNAMEHGTAFNPDQSIEVHPIEFILPETSLVSTVAATRRDLEDAIKLAAAGQMHVPIGDRYPLDGIADALAALRDRRVLGRQVLQLA